MHEAYSKSVHWENPDGWGGEEGIGRKVQDGGPCTPEADSC